MNIFIASKASVRLTLVGNHCGRRNGCFFFIDFQQSPEPRNPPPSKFYLRGGGNANLPLIPELSAFFSFYIHLDD